MFKHNDDDIDDVNGAHTQEPEVDFEPDEEMGDLAGAQTKIKKLRDQLKEAQSKRDEYLDGWQRCKAESVNVRKEAFAAGDRAASRAKDSVIEDIIPVLDSFDMAATGEAWANVDESWRSGIEQIRNQLLDVLSRNGVTRYTKVGDMSDHNLHEIVQEMEDVAGESGEIVRILRYGYKTQEKILRPAQVIVKK
ncbi:nucleotide exchange factor GrpE [Candidatus Kaiserbacteria bacterium]|nr:nucleotide exchange factor GrpE [Candidatus Kaiserbacteria bacterium]